MDYELLRRGDPDETRFVLGRIILDTLNSELGCQANQNASMDISSNELVCQEDQNAIMTKKGQIHVPYCPEKAEHARITTTIEELAVPACLEKAREAVNDELVCKMNEHAAAVKEGQLPLPACPEIAVNARDGECDPKRSENVIRMKRTPVPLHSQSTRGAELTSKLTASTPVSLTVYLDNALDATKHRLNSQQTRNTTSMDKRPLPLHSVFSIETKKRDSRSTTPHMLSTTVPMTAALDNADVTRDELNHLQNQNVMAVDKRHFPHPGSLENAMHAKDKLIRRRKVSVVTTKRQYPTSAPANPVNLVENKTVSQQNQNASAVKRKHIRLSALFR